ncbi:MAG: class C beta-lactamase-related serine hydrolase [Candidatus Abyssobacteria bacterium SURF_17]|jgi:CubicO group peptidase (beta-lactamase class C family)|uniref:Class C beta-lactamase-related serine hydrolase n=1 Tax=Candidatus Abyssobacteria bacterium SURF_17 TaxID=2093361 RepID=A0A419ET65_9BACT|nr:MAG: class C beta-lactamase-related serine hydrolase [Candidatus Abyssubacteria bacterium SURF_17]
MKARRLLLGILLLPLVVVAVAIVVGCVVWSPTYVYRCLAWGQSDIRDCDRFPYRGVGNEPPVFHFARGPENNVVSDLFDDIEYRSKGKKTRIGDLDDFLKANDTTGFIVIKDDAIWYENYFNGYTRDSVNTSFSMAKSFTSALIGIAIGEGFIEGVDDPVTKYLPELEGKGFDAVTIKHLLLMASGIKYVENGTPWGDDARTYYDPDLRRVALEAPITAPVGKYFLYNNYHPMFLGMILERATGKPVAQYLEEKIWKPLGMEYPASWSIDSEESGFEKMESGINARAIDFAKFGRLFLNRGRWDGQQIVLEEWVAESTRRDRSRENPDYYAFAAFNRDFFASGKGYYKYMWWGYTRDEENDDFIACGHLGQFIYVCPAHDVIIVRNGKTTGAVDMWTGVLFAMASALGNEGK